MPDHEPVDDDLDRVPLVLVERFGVGEIHELPVHPGTDEALATGALEDSIALRLAILDERTEHEQPGPFRQGQDLVHDLLDRLAFDLMPVRAERMTDAGE